MLCFIGPRLQGDLLTELTSIYEKFVSQALTPAFSFDEWLSGMGYLDFWYSDDGHVVMNKMLSRKRYKTICELALKEEDWFVSAM